MSEQEQQLLNNAINADDSYKVGDTSIRDYANEFLDKRNALKDVAAMINQEGNAPLVHRQYISDHVDVPGWLADVDDDNIERIGEKHQSTANKIKNGFVQAAGGFTAGFIQSFTSMADAWNHTTGNYKYNPDSIVDNAMEDMNNYLQREYRIFGANHRGFNASYISNIIAQSGTTFGMIGANALIEAGIAALAGGGIFTGGTSTAVAGTLQAARLATLPRLLKYLARTGLYASQTAAMNSQESARDVYQEALMAYGDKDIAIRMATDQANRDYKGQLAFGLVAGHLVERIMSKSLGRYIAKKVGANVPERSVVGRATGSYLGRLTKNMAGQFMYEGAQESGEEMISEYNKSWTLFHGGIIRPMNWDNIIDSFIAGGVFGALGGVFHTPIRSKVNPNEIKQIQEEPKKEMLALPPIPKALPPIPKALPNPYEVETKDSGFAPGNGRVDEALDSVDHLRTKSINDAYDTKPDIDPEDNDGITDIKPEDKKRKVGMPTEINENNKDKPKDDKGKTIEEYDEDIDEDPTPIHGNEDNPLHIKREPKQEVNEQQTDDKQHTDKQPVEKQEKDEQPTDKQDKGKGEKGDKEDVPKDEKPDEQHDDDDLSKEEKEDRNNRYKDSAELNTVTDKLVPGRSGQETLNNNKKPKRNEKKVKQQKEEQSADSKETPKRDGSDNPTNGLLGKAKKVVKPLKEKAVKFIASTFDSAVSTILSYHNSIHKDINAIRVLTQGKSVDDTLKAIDTMIDALKNHSAQETSTGNEDMDALIKDMSASVQEEIDNTIKFLEAYANTIRELQKRREETGDKSMSDYEIKRMAKHLAVDSLLKQRLKEINNQLNYTRKMKKQGLFAKAIQYLHKRFAYIDDFDIGENSKVSHMANFMVYQRRVIKQLLKDNAKEFYRGDSLEETNTMDDMFDIANSYPGTEVFNEAREHFAVTGENQDKTIPAVNKMQSNNTLRMHNPNDTLYNGKAVLRDVPMDYMYRKASKFMFFFHRFLHAGKNGALAAVSKERMLNEFMKIKHALEYRLQRNVSNIEVLQFIYKNEQSGLRVDGSEFVNLENYIAGLQDFSFDENRGGTKVTETKVDPITTEIQQEVLQQQHPVERRYKVLIINLQARIDEENPKQATAISQLIRKIEDALENKKYDKDTFRELALEYMRVTGENATNLHIILNTNYDPRVNDKEDILSDIPNVDPAQVDKIQTKEELEKEQAEKEKKDKQDKSKKKKPKKDGYKKKPIKKVKKVVKKVVKQVKKGGKKVVKKVKQVVHKLPKKKDELVDNLDNNLLHLGDVEVPVNKATPNTNEVIYGTGYNSVPKKGIVNRYRVRSKYKHYRKLANGKYVELPVTFRANEHTLKILNGIVSKWGGNDMSTAWEKALSTFVKVNTAKYRLMYKDGKMYYHDKVNDTVVEGFPPEHDLEVNVIDSRMNDNSTKDSNDPVVQHTGMSYKQYMDSIAHTKYHSVVINGTTRTIFGINTENSEEGTDTEEEDNDDNNDDEGKDDPKDDKVEEEEEEIPTGSMYGNVRITNDDKTDDDMLLKELVVFNYKMDFVKRILIPNVLKLLSGKKLTLKNVINAEKQIRKEYRDVLQKRLDNTKDKTARRLLENIIERLDRDVLGGVFYDILGIRSEDSKDNLFGKDDFNGDFDSDVTAFLSTISITDSNGNAMLGQLRLPVYHRIGDVRKALFTAIDNANGRLDTYNDLRNALLSIKDGGGLVKDLVNALDKAPDWMRNRVMFKMRGMLQKRSLHIDQNGNVQDADKQGGIYTSIQNLFSILRSKLLKAIKEGRALLNRKSYTTLMRLKQHSFNSSQGVVDVFLARLENIRQQKLQYARSIDEMPDSPQKEALKKTYQYRNAKSPFYNLFTNPATMLASWLHGVNGINYNALDVIGALKLFGYQTHRGNETLDIQEATNDVNGSLFYFTDDETKELQDIHRQINQLYYGNGDINAQQGRPRHRGKFNPQELLLEQQLNDRLKQIVHNKIQKSGVKVVQVNANGIQYYTLANKNTGNSNPFDTKKITGLLNSLGIHVDEDAVDRFFNDEVLTDASGNKIDYDKLVKIASDPTHEDHMDALEDLYDVMEQIEAKVMFLQHIIMSPGNLNDGVLNGTVSKIRGRGDGNTSGLTSNDAAIIHTKNELFRLYSYHYENNLGGTRAGATVGKTSNNNYVSSNAITDTVREVKDNPESFRDNPILADNIATNILNDNKRARDEMRVDSVHTDVYSKLEGNDNTILKSSAGERNKAYLSFYYSENFGGYEFDHPQYGRVKMRTMQGPVMSDKNQALVFTLPTLVINPDALAIYSDQDGSNSFAFNTQTEDGVRLAENVLNQFFGSDLRKVIKFRRTKTNINRANQREAGKYFYSFHEFNDIKDDNDISILQRIDSADENMSDEELYNKLMDEFGGNALKIIENQVGSNVDYLLSRDINGNEGIGSLVVKVHNKTKEFGKFIPSDNNKVIYDETTGKLVGWMKEDDLGRVVMVYADAHDHKEFNAYREFVANRLAEYALNNMLATNTIHNMFLGDMAVFANVKKATGKDGVVNHRKLVRDAIINSFKRWAGALGNTKKISDDTGEVYHQIVLNDEMGVATNIDTHIKFNYPDMPKSDRKKINELVDNYNPIVAKEMAEKYPKIAGELEITTTDAQEYVTWKEAIHIMHSTGKLTDEQKKKLEHYYDKLSKGQELTDKEAEDFKNDYAYMMNSHKPLGGQQMEIRDSNDEVIGTGFNYVKTSAVVLLPNFTKGKKLDNLRKLMENTGDGRTRAVYVSGMKADTVAKPINLSDIDTDGNVDRIEDATIVMKRSGWGIQSNMINHLQEDVLAGKDKTTITASTQQQSIMFESVSGKGYKFKIKTHDSVIAEFNRANPELRITNKNNVSADQLRALYAFANKKLIELSHAKLYSKLGAGLKNLPVLVADTIELSNPNSPLVETIRNSSVYDLFNHANEQVRYIVHSLVQNNLSSIKVHGMSLLTMSSAGLESNGTGDADGIVYVGDYKPGNKLKGARYENGKFHPAEILLPSYFTKRRADGTVEIIDLTDEKYSYKDENGHLRLKEGVIDDELLITNSPRIPYSNINSGSSYKIVGFLPRHMANTAIIPDSIIQQKGSDNDGDKEFIQLYNYRINEDGKIVRDGDIDGGNENTLRDAYEDLILDVTNAVYHSDEEGVQKEVLKPLSSAPAKTTLETIEDSRNSNDPEFAISNYTDMRFADTNAISGQGGKIGVGYYSSESVKYSALRTQSKNSEPILIPTPFGHMNMANDADGELSKADMISIMQNESVDNAKNNNLGLMNAGNVTQGIYAGLIHIGFGKGNDKHSGALNQKGSDGKEYNLPMLMMSLPVVSHIIRKHMMMEITGKDTVVDIILNIDGEIEDMKLVRLMSKIDPNYKVGQKVSYKQAVQAGHTELAEYLKERYNAVKGRQEPLDSYSLGVRGKDLGKLNRAVRGKQNKYGQQYDVKFQQDWKSYANVAEVFDELFDEYLTPDMLLALHRGEREVNGKPLDVVLANRVVMAKMMLAHKAHDQFNEASNVINKTHSAPSTVGEFGRKMYDIYTAFTSGSLSLLGDYKLSDNIDPEDMYDVIMDIIDNLKPTTPEGVRFINNMKSLSQLYDKVFPEYHNLIRLAFNTIADTKRSSDIHNYLDSLVEQYHKYKRSSLFADSKEELDNLLLYTFGDPGVDNVYKRDLAYKIGNRQSSSSLWQTNKLLSNIGVDLRDGAKNRLYVTNMHANLDELMEGFIDLVHDKDTVLFNDGERDITAREFAFLLATHAHFSNNKKIQQIIPMSFYTNLGEQSKGSIEEFYDQYIRNNQDHLMVIDKFNHAYPITNFGKHATINYSSEEVANSKNKERESFYTKIDAAVYNHSGITFHEDYTKDYRLRKYRPDGVFANNGQPLEISRLAGNAKRGKGFILKGHAGNGGYDTLIIQDKNGNFVGTHNYYDQGYNFYNSATSRKDSRDGFVMPKSMDNIESVKAIDADEVANKIVDELILQSNELTPEQITPLKFVADNARYDLVDDNGRKVAQSKDGLFNITIPYNNGDIAGIYSKDSKKRDAKINQIKRDFYTKYAQAIGVEDVTGYVNDMMTPKVEPTESIDDVKDNIPTEIKDTAVKTKHNKVPLQTNEAKVTDTITKKADSVIDKVSDALMSEEKKQESEEKLDGIDENNKCK